MEKCRGENVDGANPHAPRRTPIHLAPWPPSCTHARPHESKHVCPLTSESLPKGKQGEGKLSPEAMIRHTHKKGRRYECLHFLDKIFTAVWSIPTDTPVHPVSFPVDPGGGGFRRVAQPSRVIATTGNGTFLLSKGFVDTEPGPCSTFWVGSGETDLDANRDMRGPRTTVSYLYISHSIIQFFYQKSHKTVTVFLRKLFVGIASYVVARRPDFNFHFSDLLRIKQSIVFINKTDFF